MKINKYIFAFFILLGLAAVISSCSTKKNAFLNRAFHNLAARDNGYFNANIKVKEGAQAIADAHEDHYDRILSVFRYGDASKSRAASGGFDEAIKKSSVVISRHSMLINGTEYCKWIDDNYLVIGKSQFYKREYPAALETFQYIAAQYLKEDSRYEGFLWMAKTYIEQGNFTEAESVLEFINNEAKFPPKLKGELFATNAYFDIIRKEYEKAIPELVKAIPKTKNRSNKTRYMFILAQLYQKQGDNKKAFLLYGDVIKRNPAYEMAFNAKINQARCFDTFNGNSADVKKRLAKMLKDEKNKEYLDQIYYALASIAIQEKDIPLAITYLLQSVKESKVNIGQKAQSYLELANIYFEKPEYVPAQAYFDSTVTFLSKDHPDYNSVLAKRNNLDKLIKNIRVVTREDSLQKLALLSEKDRNAAIDKVIARAIKDEERRKQEEAEKKTLNSQFIGGTTAAAGTGGAGNAWYFYNPSSISFGYTDFTKRWGNRPIEDNWRRSNKESVSDEPKPEAKDSTQAAVVDSSDEAKISDIKDKKQYLRNIPLEAKQLERSNKKIVEALYNLTIIYKEQLQDNAASALNGEELLKRYPENKYKLPMYYHLYRVYLLMGKQERSDYYKNLILNNFPDSEYAQIIKDPNYAQNAKERMSKAQNFYRDTYQAYINGAYPDVIAREGQARQLFPNHKLLPKFDYLKALAIAKTQGLAAFETALGDIIKKYPTNDIKTQAEETLYYINELKNRKPDASIPTVSKSASTKEIYSFRPDTVHYYVIAGAESSAEMSKLKSQVVDYNKRYYALSKMNMQIIDLQENKMQLLVIKQFVDKDDAEDYMYRIKEDPDAFSDFEDSQLMHFVMTPSNYAALVKDKDVARYQKFFKINYPYVPHF